MSFISNLRAPPHRRLLLLGAALLGGVTWPAYGDTVLVRNASGLSLTSQPLQIGHAFLPGEIANTPALLIGGTPLAAQAEVTHRWADGSVRFATISTVLPSLAPAATVSLTFASTSATSSTTTVADLLAAFPDFDAKLDFTQGATTRTVSARAMLAAGAAEWLARGPLRCELRVADHVGRSYDFGFDTYKPIRPTFYLTFWPTLGKVRVRVVVESPNLDAMEEVPYEVSVSLGLAAPATVYTKSGVTHYFGTRWTKIFWIGGTPEQKIDVQADLAHFAATGLIPNYDPTNPPPAGYVDTQWAYWQAAPRELYERGFWTRYMPTTGGRPDIGPVPGWAELWLATGDWRTREMTLVSADLAGAWPMNFRENDPTKFFDREHVVAAPGHAMSLNAHPTLWFPDNNGNWPGIIAGATMSPDWECDGAHQPDAFSVPYLMTGDRFYLESLQFWAASRAFVYHPGVRGPPGYGGLQDQVRGNAWVFRNRALAATLSLDGTPERRYFTQLVEDALATWEGERSINDPSFAAHPARIFAAVNYPMAWSPLRFWSAKDTDKRVEALWMDWYFMAELGFARDLGFKTAGILQEYSKLLTAQVNTPGYDPHYVGVYYTYTIDDANAWLADWSALAAYNLAKQPTEMTNAISNFTGGDPAFPIEAAFAGATITKYSNGPATWAWLKANVHDTMTTYLAGDYRRWKLLPLTSAPPAPPESSTTTSSGGTGTAPTITADPTARTIAAGTSTSFSVTATGDGPLSYQWRKGGVNISGANSATYSLSNVSTGNAGEYSVIVSNLSGSALSATATLTVSGTGGGSTGAPAITGQSASRTVPAGATVFLNVSASGNATLTYQWRKDGVNIGGATSATWLLANVTAADSGSYTVIVTNSLGSVTSPPIALTVSSGGQTVAPSNAIISFSVE